MGRGLSPIVSTLILLVAAIVGGAAAYAYFAKTMSSLMNKPNLVIDSAEVVATTSTESKVLMRLANLGSVTVVITGAQVVCDNGTVIDAIVKELTNFTLEPGRTWSGLVTLNTVLDSKCYRIALKYEAPDGTEHLSNVIAVTFGG